MRVFVSYRSEDRAAVGDIVAGLTQEGFEVWWDQGLIPTEQWRSGVAAKLAEADCVVAVWSTNSVDLEAGKWVIQEAEEADRRNVLVPILIDDVLPPLGLRHRQAGDLIDWRGDKSDSRWVTFIEVVRAKLEKRDVDRGKIAESGKQSARGVLGGRGALLILVAGLAALVLASALSFGIIAAITIVGALTLAYFVLNMLLGRRRNERAAATFLRRALMVTWVTYAANALVWTGAVGVFVYPVVHTLLFEEVTIWVVDEMRRPVTNSEVTISTPDGERRVTVDEDGRATWEYPRYWGEDDAEVEVRSGDTVTRQQVERRGRRFANIVVATPSGQSRFRISHVTLDGGAIDAVLRSTLPPDIAREFPRVSGVVRNAVFEEALQALRAFDRAGRSRDNRFEGSALHDEGEEEDLETSETSEVSVVAWENTAGRDLLWPEALGVTVLSDFQGGILGCAPDQPLGRDYRLVLGRDDRAFETGAGFARPDTEADAALRQLNIRAARRGRSVAFSLLTLVDHSFLRDLPIDIVAHWYGGLGGVNSGRFEMSESDREERERARRIAEYLVARRMPAGIDVASVHIFHDSRFCGESFAGVRLNIPAPKLRVSIIENVSREDVPIEAIVQGFVEREGIETWSPGAEPTATYTVPWAGGVLRAGSAIIVPRRLILDGIQTAAQVAEWRGRQGGEALHFEVIGYPGAATQVASQDGAFHRAHRFTIGANQVIAEQAEALLQRGTTVPYVVGSSVEALTFRVNGVDYPLREDRGVTLAMFGVYEMGSCPFVFADADGQGMLNRGHVLTNLASAASEGATQIYLGRSVRRIEIRELEPETSYINAATLVVHDRDGSVRRYPARNMRLRRNDESYAVLEQGDAVTPRFDHVARETDAAIYLEVSGYYLPTLAPNGAYSTRALSRLRY